MKNIIGVMLCLVTLNANSAVITYDEGIDGDLSDVYYAPTNVGTAGSGLNTITGTTTVTVGTPFSSANMDSFIFTVPTGYQISSFTVDHNDQTVDAVNAGYYLMQDATYEYRNGAYHLQTGIRLTDVYIGTLYPTNPIDVLALTGGLPLMAGTYAIEAHNMSFNNIEDSSIDYTWSVEVSPVPIPSAVWLFGSGLIGLIGLARRKANA